MGRAAWLRVCSGGQSVAVVGSVRLLTAFDCSAWAWDVSAPLGEMRLHLEGREDSEAAAHLAAEAAVPRVLRALEVLRG